MKLLAVLVPALAVALLAVPASAADEAAPAATQEAQKPGAKENKERINLVARKPLRHDIGWLDEHDRAGWREFTTWQGVRDERPLIARKTIGFHEPRPYATRRERVERTSRGPLRGPAPPR